MRGGMKTKTRGEFRSTRSRLGVCGALQVQQRANATNLTRPPENCFPLAKSPRKGASVGTLLTCLFGCGAPRYWLACKNTASVRVSQVVRFLQCASTTNLRALDREFGRARVVNSSTKKSNSLHFFGGLPPLGARPIQQPAKCK